MYSELPTIEEAQDFLRIINKGRKAMGLDQIARLEFDACEPNSMLNCLSARHLFEPAGFLAGTDYLANAHVSSGPNLNVPKAINGNVDNWKIPGEILKITDPFDRKVPGLRERLVEAGVV